MRRRREGVDLGTVAVLARLQLVALGRVARSACTTHRLSCAGSFDSSACAPSSAQCLGVERGRQAEHREEARGVEEEGDAADPVA